MARIYDKLTLLAEMGAHPPGVVFCLVGALRTIHRCMDHLSDLPRTLQHMLGEGADLALSDRQCPTCRDGAVLNRMLEDLPEMHANGAVYYPAHGRDNAPSTD